MVAFEPAQRDRLGAHRGDGLRAGGVPLLLKTADPAVQRGHVRRGDQNDGEHRHRVRHVKPQSRIGRVGCLLRPRPVARVLRPGGQGPHLGDPPPFHVGGPPHRRQSTGRDRGPALQQHADHCCAQANEYEQQSGRGGHRRGEQVQRLHNRAAPRAEQESGTRPPPTPDRKGQRLGHGPRIISIGPEKGSRMRSGENRLDRPHGMPVAVPCDRR